MTAIAMALKFTGVDTDPERLNSLMRQNLGDFTNTGNVVWDSKAVRSYGRKFSYFKSRSTLVLENALCQGNPVIVGVNLTVNGPGHYVLVTGKLGNQFTIADPGFAGRDTLDYYGNIFETRGTVGLIPVNREDKQGPTNEGSINFVIDTNANLLVVDSIGRRAGVDPATGEILQEIPNSLYFEDTLDDDETGEASSDVARVVRIGEPSQGAYQVNLMGQGQGSYQLGVTSFAGDGTPQPSSIISGTISQNMILSHTIPYTSLPTVVISGRVLTPSGLGLRNAVVALTDSQGIRRSATTSSFGIYTFNNVQAGASYVIGVASKRYRFAPRNLLVNSNLTDVDFIGLE